MVNHELPCSLVVFDHILLNGIMVLDMVVHGQPWPVMVDHGQSRLGSS